MGRIVAAAAYKDGRRIADIALVDGRSWAEKPGHFVWIGIYEPTEAELKDLQHQFGLHELAVEDALQAHQRPKLETYGENLFVVLRTAQRGEKGVEFGETHVFVGPGFIISVRHGPSSSYSQVRARCEAEPRLLRHGVDFVLHAIIDFVVDSYGPVMDAIETEVVALEARLMRRPTRQRDIAGMYGIRRELLQMRRAVVPTAQVSRQLFQLNFTFIDEAMRPYFRDVADHAQTAQEELDTLRELLDHVFEAGFLLEASRQNVVQRRFAAWAAILACPTAIAGIYGMNFEFIPELHWQYGYFMVMGLITALCSGLFILFRRAGWL